MKIYRFVKDSKWVFLNNIGKIKGNIHIICLALLCSGSVENVQSASSFIYHAFKNRTKAIVQCHLNVLTTVLDAEGVNTSGYLSGPFFCLQGFQLTGEAIECIIKVYLWGTCH